jgi:hypothetical protein
MGWGLVGVTTISNTINESYYDLERPVQSLLIGLLMFRGMKRKGERGYSRVAS